MEIDVDDEEKIIIYSLGALDGTPLRSKIKLQKLLFLFSNVFESYKEILEFEPHLFGPYSETINQLLEDLEKLGIIDSDGNKYKLTKKGFELFKKLKPNKELMDVIGDFKQFLNDMTDDELLAFIYVSYPRFIGESAKWDKLKEIRDRLAISLLKKEKISFGKAIEISGLKASEFEKLLKKLNIKWKYDNENLG